MADKIPIEEARSYLDIIGRLRSMRMQTEAAEREKLRLQMQRESQIRDEQLQKMKFILTKRAQYWQGMAEGPSKELAREQTRGYFEGLPPWAKEALAPYRMRLFDPQEEKLMAFKRMFGDGPRGSGATLEDNPLQFAYDRFAEADYQWQMQRALGYETPFPTSIPLTGDLYAVRPEGERHVKLMSLEREELKERYGKLPGSPSPEEVAGAGYKWHLNEGNTLEDGPNTYLVQQMINLQPGPDYGKTYTQTRQMFRKEGIEAKEMPAGLRQFMSYVGTGGDSDTEEGRRWQLFRQYRKAGMSPKESLARTAGAAFPGWNIKTIDPAKISNWLLFKRYATSEKEAIVACPGHRDFLPGLNDTVHPMYYDEETGDFYDNSCRHRGKMEDATQWAMKYPGMRKGD